MARRTAALLCLVALAKVGAGETGGVETMNAMNAGPGVKVDGAVGTVGTVDTVGGGVGCSCDEMVSRAVGGERERYSSLTGKYESCSGSLEKCGESSKKFEESLKTCQGSLNSCEGSLKNCSQEQSTGSTELGACKSRLQVLEPERAVLEKELTELRQLRATHEEASEVFQRKLSAVTTELETATETVGKLREANGVLKTRARQEVEMVKSEAIKQINSLQAQRDELEAQVAQFASTVYSSDQFFTSVGHLKRIGQAFVKFFQKRLTDILGVDIIQVGRLQISVWHARFSDWLKPQIDRHIVNNENLHNYYRLYVRDNYRNKIQPKIQPTFEAHVQPHLTTIHAHLDKHSRHLYNVVYNMAYTQYKQVDVTKTTAKAKAFGEKIMQRVIQNLKSVDPTIEDIFPESFHDRCFAFAFVFFAAWGVKTMIRVILSSIFGSSILGSSPAARTPIGKASKSTSRKSTSRKSNADSEAEKIAMEKELAADKTSPEKIPSASSATTSAGTGASVSGKNSKTATAATAKSGKGPVDTSSEKKVSAVSGTGATDSAGNKKAKVRQPQGRMM